MDSFPSANGCKLAGWLGHRKDFEIKVLQNRFTTQKKSEHIYVWRTLLEKLLETWGTSLAEEFYGSRKACGTKSLLQAVLYLFLFIFTSYKIFTSSCGKISLLNLNFVANFRHTCAFSRSSSLLWRTLMLPIKADLFFRFWRLEMITLLPWILEIYSQSCEMIYNLQIQPCIEVTSIRDWNLVSVPIFVTVHHHWRTLPYDLSQGAPCCTAGGAGFVQPQPDVCRPISIPPDDAYYKPFNRICMEYRTSLPIKCALPQPQPVSVDKMFSWNRLC